MSETVKKQHYIWRKYLTEWTDNGDKKTGKVYVFRKTLQGKQAKIEFRGLEAVGFEKYFYDISNFTDEDISLYTQLIEHLQKDNKNKLMVEPDLLSNAKVQRDFIEKTIISGSENIDNDHRFLDRLKKGDFEFYEDSGNVKVLRILKKLIFESILYNKPCLPDDDLLKLVNENVEFDTIDLKSEFNRYISMQYFRSKRLQDHFKKVSVDTIEMSKKENLNSKFLSVLTSIYFAEIFAINISDNFYSAICLIENESLVPFITADTPIVNLLDENDDKLIFFYPLSPKIAIKFFVQKDEINNSRTIIKDELEIKNLNKMIFDNSINEVYANDKKTLEAYM